MQHNQDGVLSEKPWGPPSAEGYVSPRWTYKGPWVNNESRLVNQALSVMQIPGEELADMVRPNLPQIALFPPRRGYRTHVPGINDIVQVDRFYQNPRVAWFSGGPAGYSGTTRNAGTMGSEI